MLPNLPSIVTWYLRGLGVAPGIGNIVAQQRYTTSSSGVPGTPIVHYYHPNHRGDTAYLTDVSGVKAATYIYDAFGRLLSASSIQDPGSSIIYLFSGKEWDSDAQLYYFGFRWYDPDTGTWTTKDPLSYLGAQINIFLYCHNSPLLFVDPYGLATTGLDSVSIQDPEAWKDFPEISDMIRQVQESNRCYINNGWDRLGQNIKSIANGITDIKDYVDTAILHVIRVLTDKVTEGKWGQALSIDKHGNKTLSKKYGATITHRRCWSLIPNVAVVRRYLLTSTAINTIKKVWRDHYA